MKRRGAARSNQEPRNTPVEGDGGGGGDDPMAASLDGSPGATFMLRDWATSNATSGYSLGLKFTSATLPGAGELAGVLGLYDQIQDRQYPAVFVNEDGDLLVYVGTTLEINEAAALAPYFDDGSDLHEIVLTFTSTSLTVEVNGVEIGAATTGWTIPTTVDHGAPLFFGCADQITGGINGVICDVTVTDLASATNSAAYYLVADGTKDDGDGSTGWYNNCLENNSLWASGSTVYALEILRPVTQVAVARTYTEVEDTATFRRLVGANGRRPYPTPTTGRKVYLSSSVGSDGNDGLSEGSPKASLAAGFAMMRDGYDDQLLCKYGDTWDEDPGNLQGSGISIEQPLLWGAYGTRSDGLPTFTLETAEFIQMTGSGVKRYWMFADLEYAPTGRTNNAAEGIDIVSQADGARDGLWFENVIIRGSASNAITESGTGPTDNVVFRRCAIIDTWNTSGNAQGIFLKNCHRVVFDDCVFNRSQRMRTDPASQGWTTDANAGYANDQSHNLYIQSDCTGLEVYGLLSCNASGFGAQLRCGGHVRDFVSIGNPVGVVGGNDNLSLVSGVVTNVHGAYFYGADDIAVASPGAGDARGFGLFPLNEVHSAWTKIANGACRAQITDNATAFLKLQKDAGGDASIECVLFRDIHSVAGKLSIPNPITGNPHLVKLRGVRWSQAEHPGSPTVAIDTGDTAVWPDTCVLVEDCDIETMSGSGSAYQRIAANQAASTWASDITDLGSNTFARPTFTDEDYSPADFATAESVSPATEKGLIEAWIARVGAATYDTSIGAPYLLAAAYAAFDLD